MFQKKEKKKTRDDVMEDKSMYFNKVFLENGYDCDRCGKNIILTPDKVSNENIRKEVFDFYSIVGFILCPECREEYEHSRKNPYKMRSVFSFQDGRGSTIGEDVTEYFENRRQVEEAIEMAEKKINETMLSLGYIIRDKRYEISYIPFADRRD